MNTVRGFAVAGVVLLALGSARAADAPAVERLPALGATPSSLTVSGISSGGYMAGQFHVAHSGTVAGVGIIAAGPYACAQNSMLTALGACVKGGIEVAPLVNAAGAAAARDVIDPLQGVRDDRVWLFHGSADAAVNGTVVAAAREFYTALGVRSSALRQVGDVAATHGIPTLATGAACERMLRPYLNACDYDAAGEMLRWLRGDLEERTAASGRLVTFDQREFGDAGLNDSGLLYIPTACAKPGASQDAKAAAAAAGAGSGATPGACSVHVFFHGCDQSAEVVGDMVARGAGFNEWAEANSIVVLYPQARSSKLLPLNPLGCWDWWGYTGEQYATREGRQISAVQAMIARLTSEN